jgi:hypothetical protein
MAFFDGEIVVNSDHQRQNGGDKHPIPDMVPTGVCRSVVAQRAGSSPMLHMRACLSASFLRTASGAEARAWSFDEARPREGWERIPGRGFRCRDATHQCQKASGD